MVVSFFGRKYDFQFPPRVTPTLMTPPKTRSLWSWNQLPNDNDRLYCVNVIADLHKLKKVGPSNAITVKRVLSNGASCLHHQKLVQLIEIYQWVEAYINMENFSSTEITKQTGTFRHLHFIPPLPTVGGDRRCDFWRSVRSHLFRLTRSSYA